MAKKNSSRDWPTDEQESETILRSPAEFGTISIGESTASLAVKIEQAWLSDSKARNVLCGRRVQGTIIIGEFDLKQAMLIEDADYRVQGVFDIKSLRMTPTKWSLRLTFSRSDIDVGKLSHFAKQKGQILITATQELPIGSHDDEKSDAADETEDEEETDGKMAATGK